MSTNEKELKENISSSDSLGLGSIEGPKYSCALGGAYGTALAVYGLVPLLHSGLGCGLGQLFGQLYAGGQNAGGPVGGTSTPTTGLVEEHVIFSGCVPALIGDDVNAVVREYGGEAPLFSIDAPGFSGNSYEGYELFFEALINQILAPLPKEKGTVNIFGVVPYQHIFWKGELDVVKNLLEKIGVKANIIFTEADGVEKLKQIPQAEYNVVLSAWNGHRIAKKIEEKFEIPFITFPGVPIGPKQISNFLRTVGEKLGVDSKKTAEVIKSEERRTYRFIEYSGDALILVHPHSYFAVVTDSNTAIGVTQFLVNEMGYLPDIIQLTDNPPEEYRENIIKELTEKLEITSWPDIVFEPDSHLARENLRGRPFQFLFASSLEANSAHEFGALHVTVGFPSYNHVVLDDSYAGYRGSLRLIEDYISTFAGPL